MITLRLHIDFLSKHKHEIAFGHGKFWTSMRYVQTTALSLPCAWQRFSMQQVLTRRRKYVLCSRVEARVHRSSRFWWPSHHDPYCWIFARNRIRILLSLWWMQPKLVPSWMGLLRWRLAARPPEQIDRGNSSWMRDYTSLASPFLVPQQSCTLSAFFSKRWYHQDLVCTV